MLELDRNIRITFIQVARYVILMSLLLYIGTIFSNILYIMPFMFVLLGILKRDNFLLLFLLVVWHYIQLFFSGQGYAYGSRLYSYLIDSNLYILLVFILNIKQCVNSIMKYMHIKGILYSYFIYMAMIFVNTITYGLLNVGSAYAIIVRFSSVYIFMLIFGIKMTHKSLASLLNLIVAIIVLQIIVSYLQVTYAIPPPRTTIDNEGIASYEITPGFDDVASGTLGAWMSNKTSWLSTVGFLFAMSIAIFRHSIKIEILSCILLMQYTMVDSKTALGVTVFAFVIMLLNYGKKLINTKNILQIASIALFMIGMYRALSFYYEYHGGTHIDKATERTTNTAAIVVSNLGEWGKIVGVPFLTEYGIEHNLAGILIGFERGEADSYIFSRINPVMTQNNTLNINSHYFATYYSYGIIAMIAVVCIMLTLYRSIRRQRYKTILGKSFAKSGSAIVLATSVFCFLQGAITVTDRAFFMILMLYAIVLKYEYSCKGIVKNSVKETVSEGGCHLR